MVNHYHYAILSLSITSVFVGYILIVKEKHDDENGQYGVAGVLLAVCFASFLSGLLYYFYMFNFYAKQECELTNKWIIVIILNLSGCVTCSKHFSGKQVIITICIFIFSLLLIARALCGAECFLFWCPNVIVFGVYMFFFFFLY